MIELTPEQVEQRRWRCQVALWAYAYEWENDSLVDDATYDETCQKIDLSIKTGSKKWDNWFEKNFDPDTGMWIHHHPNLRALREKYLALKTPGEF